MRHMFIVLDASSCMNEKDLKPSRLHCVIKLLEKFAFSYFDQNPISQLGLIITNDKLAVKHCELVGNPKKLVDSLNKLKKTETKGEPSIQNSLELAMKTLKYKFEFFLLILKTFSISFFIHFNFKGTFGVIRVEKCYL